MLNRFPVPLIPAVGDSGVGVTAGAACAVAGVMVGVPDFAPVLLTEIVIGILWLLSPELIDPVDCWRSPTIVGPSDNLVYTVRTSSSRRAL